MYYLVISIPSGSQLIIYLIWHRANVCLTLRNDQRTSVGVRLVKTNLRYQAYTLDLDRHNVAPDRTRWRVVLGSQRWNYSPTGLISNSRHQTLIPKRDRSGELRVALLLIHIATKHALNVLLILAFPSRSVGRSHLLGGTCVCFD